MGLVDRDDGWRIPDWLWVKMEPLLPPRPRTRWAATAPGCRTEAPWTPSSWCCAAACRGTRLPPPASARAPRPTAASEEWQRAGVFQELWREGLLEDDEVVGIDWDFLSCDGAMTKAPLGAGKTGPNPTDRAKKGRNARSSPKAPGSPSAWPTTEPTATTTSSSKPRSIPSP